jgi:tetratricopeptide (TPR) repeat protein
MRKLLLAAPICFSLFAASDSPIQRSQRLLAAADRFAMLFNWPEAAPLYAQAESLFEESGDRKNALLARLGYLWATADTSVSPAISEEVANHLQDPFVRSDPRLMLRGLVVKAVLDRNTNEMAARESWNQILKLAGSLGDRRWEDRAKAETGQILYMDGDVKSATVMVRDALVSQYLHLDLGAAIYYTAMVGNGFVEAGRPETALQYCNTALRLAFVEKDGGFPFLAYQGKARALIALGRNAEAGPVLNDALSQARSEHNSYALAQLLVVAGTAAERSDSISARGRRC